MGKTNPLAPMINEKFQNAPIEEVIHCSTAVLEGIGPKTAELLRVALGVETIAELARNPFVLRAQALVTIAEAADDV